MTYEGWNHPRMTRAEFETKNRRMRAEELARVERMRKDHDERHVKAARWAERRSAELRAKGMNWSLAWGGH